MTGSLYIEIDTNPFIYLGKTNGDVVGEIENDGGNLRVYSELGNLVLDSDYDVEINPSAGLVTINGDLSTTSDVMVNRNLILGTSGDTVTLNKAFFDSILARLHALDGQ